MSHSIASQRRVAVLGSCAKNPYNSHIVFNPEKSGRLGFWAACALIVALTALFFSPWLLSGRVLAPSDVLRECYLPWRTAGQLPLVHNHFVSDAVTQYLPYRIVAARSLAEVGYVGWNPYVFGGTAQVANTMALTYDWTTQLHRFLDFWTAWHLGIFVRIALAGIGMFLFLRSRGCGWWASSAIGCAYMLNTEFVGWIYHQWALASFCWMPWVLWALHLARELSPRYVALVSLFLGLALLGATLQHAAFIVIALGCVWLGWLIQPGELDDEGESICVSSRWRDTALIGVAGLLAAGLVSFMLEPTITAYFENLRAGHTREGIGYNFGWTQPLMMVLAWPLTLYPFILGSVQTLDLTKALLPSGIAYAFFGSIPMLLSVVGFFSNRVPLAAKMLIAAGLIIPLTPLVGVLYQRVSLLWILGGCWAAGAWLSSATQGELDRFILWFRRILFVAIPIWLVASVVMLVFRGHLQSLLASRIAGVGAGSQFGLFSEWLQIRASNLPSYLSIWNSWQLLGLAGLLISAWGVARLRSSSVWPGAGLMLGVAMQLSVFWWQWTTWGAPEDVYQDSQVARLVQREIGETGRLAQAPGTPAEMFFPPNTLMPLGVAVTGGYDSIHPDGMRNPTRNSWDFPGTTHFLGSIDEERPVGWQEAWSDGRWVLLRNPAPVLGMVTLESGLPVPLQPVDFKRGSMNTMEAVVPAGALKVELFSNWHRGWMWREGPAESWRSSSAGSSKGIEVAFDQPTAETRVVQLQFDPSPPGWILIVTGASAVLVLAMGLFAGSRREIERA